VIRPRPACHSANRSSFKRHGGSSGREITRDATGIRRGLAERIVAIF
jgi:hypothetical protein